MKGELHNSSVKMVKFTEFRIWIWTRIFHIWSGRISFISHMKIEQLNKVLSALIMFGWDCALSAERTFRPDLVLCALGHGDPGAGLAWPLSGKLRACFWASVLRCLDSGAGQASLGTVLSSEWASLALSGVSVAVGLLVCPPPGSPPWAPGDPSGGLPGNHSNFPAHSGWVGRQVHLVNWFQGTGVGQKVNRQQVRLLLRPPSSQLSPPKRTELPLVFQPSSPVFSTSQRDKKDRACQNQPIHL